MTQTITDISVSQLLEKVGKFQSDGYRLVQICCSTLSDGLQLQYSFDKAFDLISLRVCLKDTTTPVPSVSGIYLSAFLYENEIHDLFGVKIEGIAVDYQGKFYRTAVKTPFNQPKTEARS